MIAGAAIGQHAIAEFIVGASAELVFPPVSRLMSGGIYQQPTAAATVLLGVHWDDDTLVLWDDDTPIIWDS